MREKDLGRMSDFAMRVPLREPLPDNVEVHLRHQQLRQANDVDKTIISTYQVVIVTPDPPTSERTCGECGKKYDAERSTSRYCSTACRARHHRNQRQETM